VESGQRGVVATADIKQGQQLLLVPLPATLHITSGEDGADTSEAFAYLASAHPAMSPFLRTVLALLCEQAKGEGSQFLPYLDTLPPTEDDCLLQWGEEDLALLAGMAAGSEAWTEYFVHWNPAVELVSW